MLEPIQQAIARHTYKQPSAITLTTRDNLECRILEKILEKKKKDLPLLTH